MYYQVGQSDADIVKQINKMYRMDMDATSTTLEPGEPGGEGRGGGTGMDDDDLGGLAGTRSGLDGLDYDMARDPLGLRRGLGMGMDDDQVPKSLRVRGSAAARGFVRVYSAVVRCLRDDRIEDADEATAETFRRINAKNDESFPCLKKMLNVCFVTIGVALFIGVIVALVYATVCEYF